MFRFSKLMSVTLMFALMPMAFLTGVPAEGSPAETTNDVCPDALMSDVGVDAGVHTRSINCANLWGLDIFDVDRWDPGRPATRAELAAVLARLLDVTVESGAGDLSGRFPDLGGHEYADEVLRLSSLGVINGFVDGTFGPDMNVRRDQMASMMMRLMVDLYDTDLPPAANLPFVDVTDTSVHRDNISRIYEAGITAGVTASTFEPGGMVTRAQTITFAVRLLQRLYDDGQINFVAADLPLPEPGRVFVPLVEQGITLGTDLSTDDDPGANATLDDYDRREASQWNVVPPTWDYTRHRLCSDVFRYDGGIFRSVYEMVLSFDEDYEARTGLASCLWTRPGVDASDWQISAYERPRAEWTIPDDCGSYSRASELLENGGVWPDSPHWGPMSDGFFVVDEVYGCGGMGVLIGDSAYIFEGVGISGVPFSTAVFAAGYDPREVIAY